MRKCEKKLAVSFYFPLHCIDDVSASVNNSEFSDFVDCIYTVERHIEYHLSVEKELYHTEHMCSQSKAQTF
jgi:hypothetical protein